MAARARAGAPRAARARRFRSSRRTTQISGEFCRGAKAVKPTAAETDCGSVAAASNHARQAVLFAPGDLRLCDFTPPRPGPGELLLRVKCALSCGTDLKTYRRGHPVWRLPTPFGHEFAGVVAEVGEGVTGFKA